MTICALQHGLIHKSWQDLKKGAWKYFGWLLIRKLFLAAIMALTIGVRVCACVCGDLYVCVCVHSFVCTYVCAYVCAL